MSTGDEISLRDYFNEKFSELKQSICELKQEIRTNQNDMQGKVLKMEEDLNRKITKLEQDVNEFLFIKKYWKLFAVALFLFGMTTIYTVKKQLDGTQTSHIENVVRK